MTYLDYQARAELYLGRDRQSAAAQGSRRFSTAAKAIRFAIEEAAPVSLHGAWLQTSSAVFSGDELIWLYHSQNYPLPRKQARENQRRPREALWAPKKEPEMQKFNYDAFAELYPSRRYAKSQQTQYRRFDRAAEAIRYVVEELPGKWLAGSHLEVDEQRFEGAAILELYESADYPLSRAEIAA